jgi:hypothetical protein
MPLSADSPFATETMADLLEQQDHHGDAQAVRQVLEPPEAPGTLAAGQGVAPHDSMNHRARVIATLERWLENLRRGSR